MLQAPVLGYRRGRGVLDGRDPFSVTLPLGRELWGEADVVLAVGTRLLTQLRQWGIDRDLAIIRVDADAEEHGRLHKPAVALTGDAKPILQRLIDELPAHNAKRASARGRDAGAPGRMAQAPGKTRRRSSPSWTPSAPNCRRTAFSSTRSPRSALPRGWPFRSTSRAPSSRPATRTISAGALPPRSARRTPGPTCRWWRSRATAASCSPPTNWRPPCATAFRWSTIVFNDGAFGNVRRIQQERYGNRLIASDLANPDFVAFAKSFGAEAVRAKTPDELRRRCGAPSPIATARR